MKAQVTYQQAVKLFKAGKLNEEQFNKIYEMHHKKLKEEHEKNCVEVTVKPVF